jgi:elongator complex protein 3
MQTAEQIAGQARGYKRLSVISGVGVRGYYKKLGYELQGTYMVKSLSL